MEYFYPNFGSIEGYKRMFRLRQMRAIGYFVRFHLVSYEYTGIRHRFVKEHKGNYALL